MSMHAEREQTAKRPVNAERPFPWRCRQCGKLEVDLQTLNHDAEVRYDGRLCTVSVPRLEIPVCRACGAKVFTEKVDQQINAALRSQLHLLGPEEIRQALDRVGMSPREAAQRLGIEEATLSCWLNDTQIQSRAMDNFLRVFFDMPAVRAALLGRAHVAEPSVASHVGTI